MRIIDMYEISTFGCSLITQVIQCSLHECFIRHVYKIVPVTFGTNDFTNVFAVFCDSRIRGQFHVGSSGIQLGNCTSSQ